MRTAAFTGVTVKAVASALALFAGVAGMAGAQAQTPSAEERAPNPQVRPPQVVDFPTVMRMLQDQSARTAVERQAISAAEADRITAGAYPNPSISVGQSRQGGGDPTVFTGNRQTQASVDIPLVIGGQRTARISLADRGIEAARARVTANVSQMAADAAAAYVALLSSQDTLEMLLAADKELARMRDIVAGRQSAGVASQYELARVDVERGAFAARIEDARADTFERAGDLAVLLGVRDWTPQAAGHLRPVSIDLGMLANVRERAAATPAAIAAATDEKVAVQGVEVARRERQPVPVLNLGRTWTGTPFGAANFVGFSVEVPILDRHEGQIARANAEVQTARLRRELAEAEAAATLQRLANVITARQTALDRFDRDSSSRLTGLQQMSEDAYRLGRTTILDLLDATRSRHELEKTRIDLTQSLLEAQLRFLTLTGDPAASATTAASAPAAPLAPATTK